MPVIRDSVISLKKGSGTLKTMGLTAKKLRIFYASDTTPNAWFSTIRSAIWRNNLLLPLRDLGHDVVEFEYDLTQTFRNLDPTNPRQAAFIAENRPKVSAALLRQIQAAHTEAPVDLFFSYFYDACVLPEAVDDIRRMGITAVNWYCNGSYQLDLVRQISPHYDFCLVPEKFRLQDYQAMGARPIYCQEAANPEIYKPQDVAKEFDVTFVGQAYGDRPLIIRYLVENGIRVHVWGHSWKKPDARWMPQETYEAVLAIPEELRNDPLPDDELVRMYSRSKINLDFPPAAIRMKTEAIASCRCVYAILKCRCRAGFTWWRRLRSLANFLT